MSNESHTFHGPSWHYEAQTPVVDGKYVNRTTGEVHVASGHEEYSGPPAVDIIIYSIHEKTDRCCYRGARYIHLEMLLWNIMQIIHEKKLKLDSLMATTYAIRITLKHELTSDEFEDIACSMANNLD